MDPLRVLRKQRRLTQDQLAVTADVSPSTVYNNEAGKVHPRPSIARQEGLTKTCNRFHNPAEYAEDIAEPRRQRAEMDLAAAYGWHDLDLGHGFHQTKQSLRYTIGAPARSEVLGRLLALNHERQGEEARQGLHASRAIRRRKRVNSARVETSRLF